MKQPSKEPELWQKLLDIVVLFFVVLAIVYSGTQLIIWIFGWAVEEVPSEIIAHNLYKLQEAKDYCEKRGGHMDDFLVDLKADSVSWEYSLQPMAAMAAKLATDSKLVPICYFNQSAGYALFIVVDEYTLNITFEQIGKFNSINSWSWEKQKTKKLK